MIYNENNIEGVEFTLEHVSKTWIVDKPEGRRTNILNSTSQPNYYKTSEVISLLNQGTWILVKKHYKYLPWYFKLKNMFI